MNLTEGVAGSFSAKSKEKVRDKDQLDALFLSIPQLSPAAGEGVKGIDGRQMFKRLKSWIFFENQIFHL